MHSSSSRLPRMTSAQLWLCSQPIGRTAGFSRNPSPKLGLTSGIFSWRDMSNGGWSDVLHCIAVPQLWRKSSGLQCCQLSNVRALDISLCSIASAWQKTPVLGGSGWRQLSLRISSASDLSLSHAGTFLRPYSCESFDRSFSSQLNAGYRQLSADTLSCSVIHSRGHQVAPCCATVTCPKVKNAALAPLPRKESKAALQQEAFFLLLLAGKTML